MNLKTYKVGVAVAALILGLAVQTGCVVLSTLLDVDGFAYLNSWMPLIFAGFGLIIGFLIDKLFRQKSMLEKVNYSLKEESIMDELTGQYNRRHILYELEKEIERARRYKHTLAGIMIDVDDFKKYNDKYGHLFGDTILKEITAVFDHCIRTIDVLGRYGGDEFIILLPEANPDTAKVVAERIRKAVNEHSFMFKKKTLKVTVSIGIHYFEDLSNMDKKDFIEKIDQALYLAKTAGKNRIASK